MKENEGKMENALEVRGLTKHYRGFALENVSFSLPAGCIMGFIGENGAGKSTTIRLMLGLARAEAGSVRLLGEDPAQGGAEGAAGGRPGRLRHPGDAQPA